MISAFIFILVYSLLFVIVNGAIDGCQNRQKDLLTTFRVIPYSEAEQNDMNLVSGLWHTFGLIRNILTGLILMYAQDEKYGIWVALKSGFVYVGVFTLFFDGIINKCRLLPFFYYGVVDDKWDWFDAFWLYSKKFGISNKIIKIAVFIVSIIVFFI